MLTVDEAMSHVRENAAPLAPQSIALADALGARVAEAVNSEVDSPPFDKSLFDGYAIDVHDSAPSPRVIEEVLAGGVPHHAVTPGLAIRVMTGAPLPEGANAVVKVEDCQLKGDTVELPQEEIAPGTGVMQRGASFRAGDVVIQRDARLGPLDVALLAEIGRVQVRATPRPTVAVLPTGNELVAADQALEPGQIRNSNGPMLLACLEAAAVRSVDLGIGLDDRQQLSERIAAGLQADVLLISGGVSAGVKDLVPSVLADLQVRQVFHKVLLKPGKPLWFGVYQQQDRRTLVFGLPGNPVSTLVTYMLFVVPALRCLAGEPFKEAAAVRGILADAVRRPANRPTYHPSRLSGDPIAGEMHPRVELLPWRGSADLRTLARANSLAILTPGSGEAAKGMEIDVIPLDRTGLSGC